MQASNPTSLHRAHNLPDNCWDGDGAKKNNALVTEGVVEERW
jgi:hypothetical protein